MQSQFLPVLYISFISSRFYLHSGIMLGGWRLTDNAKSLCMSHTSEKRPLMENSHCLRNIIPLARQHLKRALYFFLMACSEMFKLTSSTSSRSIRSCINACWQKLILYCTQLWYIPHTRFYCTRYLKPIWKDYILSRNAISVDVGRPLCDNVLEAHI